MNRREFLKLILGSTGLAGLTGVGITAYGTRVEPFSVGVTRLDIAVRGLPRGFDGFRIAQISDLHIGDWCEPAHLTRIAAQVSALDADVIAVTGDFVDDASYSRYLEALTVCLGRLHARDGVFGVLGNHDHWADAAAVRAAVDASPVRLLNNAHVVLRRGSDRLVIAGVDDIWEMRHDLAAALEGVEAEACVILLAHEPDYADEVATETRIGLQLSGHSHGGQVRVPLHGALILPTWGRRYDMGRYDIGGLTLFVTRGVGMIAPYVRLNCPPEIALLTLHPA